MDLIHRAAVVVTRKKPFLEWLNANNEPGDNVMLTLAAVNEEPGVYLIPLFEEEKELTELMPTAIECIWQEELFAWDVDETKWPKNKSKKTFHEWFEVRFSNVVFDLVEGSIEKEDIRE
jgi:hypothetical protein